MPLPLVAIVGRPNVGKSSLLNMLAHRLIAIVDPTAGVTRDRISVTIEHHGQVFELTDTGGYGIVDVDDLTADIEAQIQRAIDEADLILFVVDVQTGRVPLDTTVAEYLRKQDKPVLLVANKADSAKWKNHMADFYGLGFGDPLPISSNTRQGAEALLDTITSRLDFSNAGPRQSPPGMKIAVVGKRNAGKSTLINTLAGEPRVIVSEVAGTTRDSIDVIFTRDNKTFLMIDTAGVRKKARITRNDLEFYAFHRAQRSIRRADVCFLLIDSTVEVGDVDKKLARYIAENFRPCIIVVNKWDLVGDRATTETYQEYLAQLFPMLDYAPLAFISARDNLHIDETIAMAEVMYQQFATRLGTGQLNKAVEEILALRGPSSPTNQKVKVYYATQVGIQPPTIVLFVNNPELITAEYRRFFVRQLRERLPFSEVPIQLHVRSHHRSLESAGQRTKPAKSKGAKPAKTYKMARPKRAR